MIGVETPNSKQTVTLLAKLVNQALLERNHMKKLRMKEIFKFKSATTWKLYEMLKLRWLHQTDCVIGIDCLKYHLNAYNYYPRFKDFLSSVIDPAVSEINDFTDINVEYETDISMSGENRFVFYMKPDENFLTGDNDLMKAYNALSLYEVPHNKAMRQAVCVSEAGRADWLIEALPGIHDRWDRWNDINEFVTEEVEKEMVKFYVNEALDSKAS